MSADMSKETQGGDLDLEKSEVKIDEVASLPYVRDEAAERK